MVVLEHIKLGGQIIINNEGEKEAKSKICSRSPTLMKEILILN